MLSFLHPHPARMKKLLMLLTSLALLTAACSSSVDPEAQTSAENVVTSFYMALQQGDETTALSYVAPEVVDTEDFKDTFAEITTWEFTSVEVLGVEGDSVDVSFTLLIDGEEDSGTDQVGVSEADGKWWIVEIPS